MFHAHASAFARFQPVTATPRTDPAGPQAFAACTLIDTDKGWRPAAELAPGDRVQTFDGGLVPLAAVDHRPARATRFWQVPAGAIGNCSDMVLPAGQLVGFRGRVAHRLFGVPLVLAPAHALSGFRGIAPLAADRPTPGLVTLGFDCEEIAMAQTGTLLLVPGRAGDGHYHRLGYGETRPLLSLIDPLGCAPDLDAA